MGLDWVIKPLPEQTNKSNTTSTDDTRSDENEFDWKYRAKKLTTLDLPDYVANTLHEDRTAWEMDELSETLQEEADKTNEYTAETREVLQHAADWLAYWAEQDKSLYASW